MVTKTLLAFVLATSLACTMGQAAGAAEAADMTAVGMEESAGTAADAAGMAAAKGKRACEETAADDSRITYVGRVLRHDGSVSFDWSGVQCRIRFEGTHMGLTCSDSGANYYNVWIDKESGSAPDKVIRTAGNDTVIMLADKLPKGAHELILMKRTEGEQGLTTFHSFKTDGRLLQATPPKERQIEYVGDSYTCGFGTESQSAQDPFTPETENCNLTYAAIAARYFDADFSLVSHSGRGVARNYDDFGKGVAGNTITDRYGRAFDERETPAAGEPSTIPDIVVIYLGTNDFSTGTQPSLETFCREYLRLIAQIRSRYGDATPILCVASKVDPALGEYVEEACRRSGDAGIHTLTLQKDIHDDNGDLGACSHPNYRGHKKVAFAIIPYISTITGWEMEEKPLR